MNVVFYKDKHGTPGRIVAEFDDLLDPGDGWGTFAFDLGRGVKLRPGHYWISVQANQVFDTDGRWGWDATGRGRLRMAYFSNVSKYISCT